MGNSLTAETEVLIDGKKYSIRFDLAALAYLQDAFGFKTFSELFDADLTSVKNLPTVLAAGLKHKKTKITPDDLLHANIPLLMAVKAINNALAYAVYGAEVPTELPLEKKKAEESGTGKNA